jgi:DNA-binding NtrC family response regulator
MRRYEDFVYVVASDDVVYRELCRQYLLNMGCKRILVAGTYDECMTMLVHRPDIVLLDELENQQETLRTLKAVKRRDPNTYVLSITAPGEELHALEALKNGAFDFVMRGKNEEYHLQIMIKKIAHVLEFVHKKDDY